MAEGYYLDNPAGRLYCVLSKLQRQTGRKGPLMHALAEILHVDKNDRAEFLRRAAPIFDLPAQIREEVHELGFDDGTYVELLGEIEKQLPALITGTGIEGWIRSLRADAMHELKTCNAVLHRQRSQGVVSGDKLESIREQVSSLIDDVLNPEAENLAPDLRTFLLEHLRDMQSALDVYEIAGSKPLQKAMEGTVGGLVLQPQVQEKITKTSVGKKFLAFIVTLGAVFGTFNQGIEAAENVRELLSPESVVKQVEDRDDEVVDAVIIPDDEDAA